MQEAWFCAPWIWTLVKDLVFVFFAVLTFNPLTHSIA